MYTYDDFQEFNSWWELRDFCNYEGITTRYDDIDLDNVVDDYWLKERVCELAGECMWDEIDTLVRGLPDSRWEDQNYHDTGYGLELLEDDRFDEVKEMILQEFRDNDNHFDDEDDEDDEDMDDEPEASRPSRYTGGVSSVYGRVSVQDCYDQPDVTGCAAADFGRLFGF